MGLDDACNTCLVLGLGFPTTPETPPTNPPPAMAAPATSFEPFLTLGLSGECCPLTVTEKGDVNKGGSLHHRHHEELPTSAGAGDLCRPASPDVSHFSSGRVKRERELSSEEVEAEKNSCRVSDEDEDGVNARKKLRLTKQQSALLEESFKQTSTLNPNQKQALATQLSLKPRQVEVWFQNRRARRLQKELQELKALKMAYTKTFRRQLSPCVRRVREPAAMGIQISRFPCLQSLVSIIHVTNPSAAC
ncbi:hypothetical protein GQ457_06G044040 [Hibiscus cannabinus]